MYNSWTLTKRIQQIFGPNPSIDGSHMRSVILWDPLRQIKWEEGLIICPQCQSSLCPWRWKRANTKWDRPRSIYCIQEEVLLVSCVYLCESSHHEVIAHDPSVNLALKSSNIIIPFVLFHMSGVTKKLHDYVSISMQSGISTTDIE